MYLEYARFRRIVRRYYVGATIPMTQGKSSIGKPAVVANATAGLNAGDGDQKEKRDMLSETEMADEAPLVALDERIQAQIGQQLSSFYRELVNQPIPQNFMELLARLDLQEDGQEGGQGEKK